MRPTDSGISNPYVQLLVAVALQLIMLSIGPPGAWQQVANLVFAVWMAYAALVVTGRRRHLWILAVLGASPPLLTLLVPAAATPLTLTLARQALWGAFPFYLAFLLFKTLFYSRQVTHTELAGAVTVYLLLGLAFANVFEIIFLVNPDSIVFTHLGADGLAGFLDMLYFSFVTLATLGYGDVSPISAGARLTAGLEAVMGLMYMAIMIARLVSLHALSGVGEEVEESRPED